MTSKIALNFEEYGVTGLKYFGGYIDEEFLRELKGRRAVKVYKEMSTNDAVVSAILFAIKMLIRQVEWPIQPYSDAPQDEANAEFVRTCLDDMSQPWSDTVSEILSMLTYGWSWHEIVYKVRLGPEHENPCFRSRFNDGLVGWRKLPIRSQDSLYEWILDNNGGVKAMQQSAAPDYSIRTIPIEKSLLFRTEAVKGNPEGASILRGAYRSWYLKKHVENIEAIGVERDLAGMPIAWVPPDLLETDAPADRKSLLASIKKIVTNIKRDEQEGLVLPLIYDDKGNKMYDLTLLSAPSRRQFSTSEVINRYARDIALTVMADFVLLGHTKVGSYSLNSSKTELFATAIGAWLDSIADVMNRYAIPRLFEINGMPVDQLPQMTHGDIESADIQELGNFVTSLANAGADIFPNPELESYLLDQAGLPTTTTPG